MNKAFEKIIEKLEELKKLYADLQLNTKSNNEIIAYVGKEQSIGIAIEYVQEVAEEYNNGWIPCSERLPEESFGCLVTVIDCEPVTQNEFENILPYFVGYDGNGWIDADGEEIPFEVIAWQPLPLPYTKGE